MGGRLVCSLLAGVLLSAACGGGSDGDDGGKGAAGPGADEYDINAMDPDDLVDGGTLRWPIGSLPVTYNTHHVDGPNRDTSDILGAISFSCFDFDATAAAILRTEWCEKAQITDTDPKQVVTYRINSDAVFLDGSPITVEAFQAVWKVRNGSDTDYQVASTQGYDKIESVEQGEDERDVIVTFKQPYSDWQALFGALQPPETLLDKEVFNNGWKDAPLSSAGPFKWGKLDKTAQTITLVRNEKWWGPEAKLERIIFRAIDADAQIDALANKEIDFIDVGPDVNKLTRAAETAGVALRKAGGPNFRHITMNAQSEVLSDVKVRRAIGLAIDRATIAKALLGPLGVKPEPLGNHILMTNQKGYENNAGILTTADPAAAAKLLDEAGWRAGAGGTRTKDGKPLEVRFVIPTAVATSAQEGQLIQGMLAEVGVKLNIETVASADFFDKHIRPGNYDLTVFAWIGTPFPISSAKSIYALPKTGEDGEIDIQQNYARVGSAEIDALFDQAVSIFDKTEAIKVANRIDAMIWDEVHSLALYQRPDIAATRDDLANFGAFGFASVVYENIGFVKS